MSLSDHVGGVRLDALHICQGQVAQEFDIAGRALHRREGQAQDLEAQAVNQGNKIVQNHLVDLRFPNHAVLTEILPACLKLGLDQAKHLTLTGFQKVLDGGQHQLQTDEADVDGWRIKQIKVFS